jgi:tetratricopeptide (TPR) repeat protein
MRWWVAAALALAACSPREGPETAGDRAYAAGRFDLALREYQRAAAHGGGRVWAKVGAAALHANAFRAATEAYRRVAAEDPTRLDEAAEGLDAAARGAEHAGDMAALHDAVLGLRAVAPARPIARYALALATRSAVSGREAMTLIPAALAAAPDPQTFDSLLVAYGEALQAAGALDQAAPTFRAALRRSRDTGIRTRAGNGLAACALRLGLAALSAGRADAAAHWLGQAVQVDSTSWTGRRALIGLGDARVGQGDILGAAIAFQSAVVQGAPDSLSRVAADRLRRLGAPGPAGDTVQRRTP